ncbi:MAG: molecular chaperone DnaJ [Candidatus Eremiobacteraeota bacterium]|jgi:curved DNA-binding protein CbpA|nr:molecular chaperone DnaJ [Candidatus Eremiobacteraeota bacterium]
MGTYYELLGVASDASAAEIKAAYRAMVRLFHPDQNSAPNASAVFVEIEEAYETLSDPGRRSEYDRDHASSPGVPDADFFDPEQAEYEKCWGEYDALLRELDERLGRLRKFEFDATSAESVLSDVLIELERLCISARAEATDGLAGVKEAVGKLKTARERLVSSWNLFKERFADDRRRQWGRMSVTNAATSARNELDAFERAARAQPDQRPTFPQHGGEWF